jgi:hypothetical protein
MYQFMPQPGNAMMLQNLTTSRPIYYMTVSMNFFTPTAHITTVVRAEGDHVGDFE